MKTTRRILVLAGVLGACLPTLLRADGNDPRNEGLDAPQNRTETTMPNGLKRYGRLVDILDDLDHFFTIAAQVGLENSKQVPDIKNAIAQWNDIAERMPREAKAYEPAFQTYRDAFNTLRSGDARMASTLRVRALDLRNQASMELTKEYRDEDYGTPQPQQPRKPLEGGVQEKVPNSESPNYKGSTNYDNYRFQTLPSRRDNSGNNSRAPVQGKVITGDSELAWASWHKKIADAIEKIFDDKVKRYQRDVSVLWPKQPCVISYRVEKNSGGPYRVYVLKVLQKSGDFHLDEFAQESISYLDLYGSGPGMAFPPGSKRQFVDKTGTFSVGKAGVKYDEQGQKDKEVIRR